MVRLLLGSAILFFEIHAFAQVDLLPAGVGMTQYGHRKYQSMDSYYDSSGNKQALGQKLSSDMNGATLLNGSSSSDLKRLVSELQRYKDGNGKSLSDQLTLGQVDGDIDVDLQTHNFGAAYGLTSRLTLFGGIPYINARVDAEIRHGGANNAEMIRQQLGNFAYEELDAGLVQAGRINTQTLYDQIASQGYGSIDHWERQGFGDLRLGAKTGFKQSNSKSLQMGTTLTSTFFIPTGYVEQPDLLTDVSFGTGYYSLKLGVDESVTIKRKFLLGMGSAIQLNAPNSRKMRVPENQESLVDQNQETEVTMTPGHDFQWAAYSGWDFGLVDLRYSQGVQRHTQDRYSGDVAGNYDALADESRMVRHYHEASVRIDTVDLYQRNKVPFPSHLSLHHRQLIAGWNTPDEKYYELRLNTFFKSSRK